MHRNKLSFAFVVYICSANGTRTTFNGSSGAEQHDEIIQCRRAASKWKSIRVFEQFRVERIIAIKIKRNFNWIELKSLVLFRRLSNVSSMHFYLVFEPKFPISIRNSIQQNRRNVQTKSIFEWYNQITKAWITISSFCSIILFSHHLAKQLNNGCILQSWFFTQIESKQRV